MRVKDVSRASESFDRPIRLLLVAPALRILGGQAVQANYLLQHLSHEPNFEVSFVPHNPKLPGPLRLLQSIKYVRTLVTSFVYCINLLLQIPRHDIVHRSEEHTSELQSQSNLVCRLLLEKKK